MEKNEAFQNTDHYRCRLCGKRSPITQTVCSHPGCRAQLSIHGEIILVGARTAPPPQQPPIHWETAGPQIKQPVKETPVTQQPVKPQPVKPRQVKEKAPKQVDPPVERGVWSKRTTLICLDSFLLVLFSIVAICGNEIEQFTRWRYATTEDIGLGILVMAFFTALLIFLAVKQYYIWHAVACLPTGLLSFFIAGAAMEMPEYTLFFFLTMAAGYVASAVLSFIGLLRRRRALAAGSPVPAFMRKKTLLIVLDSIVCVFAMSIACTRLDMVSEFWGTYRPDLWEYVLSCFFVQAVCAGSILLAVFEKYYWRTTLNCLVPPVLFILASASSASGVDLAVCCGAALLYLWVGGISPIKESNESAIGHL